MWQRRDQKEREMRKGSQHGSDDTASHEVSRRLHEDAQLRQVRQETREKNTESREKSQSSSKSPRNRSTTPPSSPRFLELYEDNTLAPI